jgi:hypothetical protein
LHSGVLSRMSQQLEKRAKDVVLYLVSVRNRLFFYRFQA